MRISVRASLVAIFLFSALPALAQHSSGGSASSSSAGSSAGGGHSSAGTPSPGGLSGSAGTSHSGSASSGATSHHGDSPGTGHSGASSSGHLGGSNYVRPAKPIELPKTAPKSRQSVHAIAAQKPGSHDDHHHHRHHHHWWNRHYDQSTQYAYDPCSYDLTEPLEAPYFGPAAIVQEQWEIVGNCPRRRWVLVGGKSGWLDQVPQRGSKQRIGPKGTDLPLPSIPTDPPTPS